MSIGDEIQRVVGAHACSLWRRLWLWVRFGKIRPVVMDRISYTPCEIAFYGRGNKLIGYWAYGHFDPSGPYQGE